MKTGDEQLPEGFSKKFLDRRVENTSVYTPVLFVRKKKQQLKEL
jgi:hypothetical protein